MLRALIAASLRRPWIVLTLAAAVLAYGLFVAVRSRFDVYPEFAPPQVAIQTEAPGLSPEEVETLVTLPIENAVNGVGELAAVRSQSIQGFSVITAVFREGTDVARARQMVGERLLQAAGRLPQGAGPPTLAPLTSATSTVLAIGLTADRRTPMELRTFADWTLRPRLLGVPGVASVSVFGGEVRQLQIQVRPDRLIAYGLGIDDVLDAARLATGVRGAGFIETPNQRVVVRTEGQSPTPAALGQVELARRGAVSVRLSDVADVVDAPQAAIGDAAVMGRPGVLLMVTSQYGANTLAVTRAAETALAEMRPTMPAAGITLWPALFRPADFISTALRNVRSSLLLGGLFVAIVLFLFLLDLRTACISFTAIPLSLLAAVIALDRVGLSLNTMTLGGLIIAIGVVVDDAIIDVENILRRLREQDGRGAPRAPRAVMLDASLEVRSAVVYATFVVALVFLPVLTMTGVQGRLFAPLGVAFIIATLASLAVALTVTPALCAVLLARGVPARQPSYVLRLKDGHRRLLTAIGQHPSRVLAVTAAISLIPLLALPFLGVEFLPESREGHVIVHMTLAPGTALAESRRVGERVAAELLKNPHIRSVAQRIGRAEQGEDTLGPHHSEFDVDFRPGTNAEEAQAEMRHALDGFPGATFAVKPYLSERIEETVSGTTADVVVKVFGDDLDGIDAAARAVAAVLARVPGAADVQVASLPGVPQVTVRLRPDRLLALGFTPGGVLDAVQTAYQGSVAAHTYEGTRVFDVAVVLAPSLRREPSTIGALLVRSPGGLRVPLRELADIGMGSGRYAVSHEGARRVQVVSCNARGRALGAFVADAKRRVEREVRFPAGDYPIWSGAAEAAREARGQLLVTGLLAAVGIALLLAVVFARGRNLLLVLANLPFALVGGVLATGGTLSIGSLVGFITLFGLTVRNSIMLVSHYEHLVTVEGAPWGAATAVRGASERLVPILMTALVTGLGLVPLALGSGAPGREIEGPMAIVILGGLVTSTVLNLLVLPTLALRYGAFGAER